MTLPPLEGLEAMPDATWSAFGQRLRALGLSTTNLEPVVRATSAVHPALRKPVRDYALSTLEAPWVAAARLFMFHRPVPRQQAEQALGDLLGPLLDSGLVQPALADLVSPFEVAIVGDDFVLSDPLVGEPEAAMGLGATTVGLCRALVPPRPIESALDLGCGAGTIAMVMAHVARRVVATDVNPRALRLTRLNARWNGHANIEVRHGSLFEPVAADRFDRIVSQPPFVARPPGAAEATFLYGGARGDELAVAMLDSVADHLSDVGRALFVVEWPLGAGETGVDRVRAIVGHKPLQALVLGCPATSASEHTAEYAAGLHPTLDEDYERQFARRRAHLQAMGVERLELTTVVVEPAGSAPAWVDALRVGPLARLDLHARRIDALVAAARLARDREALLSARLRVPEGTCLREEQEGPGADRPSAIEARFSNEALLEPVSMTPVSLALVTHVHEAPTVAAGLESFDAELGELVERSAAESGVAAALRAGLLALDA